MVKKDAPTAIRIDIDLSESTISTASPNLVENVVILGPISTDAAGKVRRRYTPECLQQAVGIFEGAPAFVDHVDPDKTNKTRSVRDMYGYYKNVRVDLQEGKLRGSLDVFDGPLGQHVLSIVKKNPRMAGNSICATGKIRMDGGVQVVEQIMPRTAWGRPSVDLVSEPATTKSLFESTQEPIKESNMELGNLTLAVLREQRKDVYDTVFQEGVASRNTEVAQLQTQLTESKTKLTAANAELDTLKTRVKLADRRQVVDKLLSESQLPTVAVTDVFRNTLYALEERKEGDKTITVEEQVKAQIEDRRITLGLAGVHDNGGSRNPLNTPLQENRQSSTTGSLGREQVLASIDSFRK